MGTDDENGMKDSKLDDDGAQVGITGTVTTVTEPMPVLASSRSRRCGAAMVGEKNVVARMIAPAVRAWTWVR